jgi:hypothetical protein
MRKLWLLVPALWLLLAPSARADRIEDAAVSAFAEPAAVAAETSAPDSPVRVLAVYPTFLLAREGDTVRQLVKVELSSRAAGEAELRFEAADGRAASVLFALKSGRQAVAARAPALVEPGALYLRVLQAGRELARIEYLWRPPRRLTVYLSPTSHFDWGYTKTQPEVRDVWDNIFNTAIDFCRRTADGPADSRFHFTVDASYPLMLYLERFPEKEATIRELAQAGLWEVNAKLAHLLTSTTGEEVLARELYYTARVLEPRLGVHMPTAIQTDVPGLTWGNIDLYAGAGVKYLLLHPNHFYRGGAVVANLDFPHAYYWSSPSGARVLVWRSHEAYVECSFMTEGMSATAREFPRRLLQVLDHGRYPYDFLHLTHSGRTGANDNTPPSEQLLSSVREWNERFAFPRVIFSTPRTFFAALEAAGKLPSFSGDTPDWWAEGVLTNALETGISRRLHPLLADLELFASFASILDPAYAYPADGINQAVLGAYLFNEHTWGYSNPLDPANRLIFGYKAGEMKSASASASFLREEALAALSIHAGKRGDWLVLNPLGWTRSGPVRLPASSMFESPPAFRDETSGEVFHSQIDPPTGEIVLLVRDIPAFGYRHYEPVASPTRPVTPTPELRQMAAPGNRIVIENEFLRLTFDRFRGGLVSLRDLQRNLEVLDPQAQYALGQLISRHNGLLNEINLATAATVTSLRITDQGPVFTRVALDYRLPDDPLTAVRVTFTLYKGLPWTDLACTLDRYHNRPGASKYLAFPFAAPGAETTVEIPYARMRPGLDQLPGYAPFYAVSNWVQVRNPAFTAVWSPLEAPIIETGAIRMKAFFTNASSRDFPTPEPPARPHVYSEIMNNSQNTNYSYTQSGSASWTYRIALAGPEEPVNVAGRPGYELARPLLVRRLDQEGDPSAPSEGAWLKLAPEAARLVTLKRAEDGRGFILRVVETGGSSVTARLSFPGRALASASLTDVVERDLSALPVAAGAVDFDLPAFALRNIRVVLQPR